MTRNEIAEMLAAYIAAEKAVLKGKSYTINGRSLSRVDLPDIREGRQEWQQKLDEFDVRARGGSSAYAVSDFS